MNIRTLAACAVLSTSSLAHAQFISDSFTYQGTLNDEGAPANGLYDISFNIYDASIGGSIVPDGSMTVYNIEVVDGLFATRIDFGVTGSVFDTDQTRWIELQVAPSGSLVFATLSPRQRITPAPVANYALRAGTTLTDAFRNGSSIHIGSTLIPFSLISDDSQVAQMRLGSTSGMSGPGSLNLYDEDGAYTLNMRHDSANGGGGLMSIARNNLDQVGLLFDGNKSGSESAALSIFGVSQSIELNTAAAGDNSVTFPVDAINSTEILNEVGASETTQTGNFSLTDDPDVIDLVESVTINAPTDGYVLVIATSYATLAANRFGGSPVSFGVSDNASAFAPWGSTQIRLPADTETDIHTLPVATHAIFPATVGANTYYYLGDKNYVDGGVSVLNTQLSAIFIPTSYGSIARQNGDNANSYTSQVRRDKTVVEILSEQNRALRADTQRQQRELDSMKSQLQQLLEQSKELQEQQKRD